MNFWEFKADYSRGYYLLVIDNNAYRHGQSLAGRLFFIFTSLLKLIIALAFLMFILLYLYFAY